MLCHPYTRNFRQWAGEGGGIAEMPRKTRTKLETTKDESCDSDTMLEYLKI